MKRGYRRAGVRHYAPVRTGIPVLCVACAAGWGPVAAQEQADVLPLFAVSDPVEVTLTADYSLLKGDREESPDREAVVTVRDSQGLPADVSARVRTRGKFRLEPANCSFPPLRIDVDGSEAVGTVFEGQDDLKIVAPCRPERESYQQLVFSEYLAYQAYALITDASFHVRLARITYVDSSGADEPFTMYAFFIEDDDALADRFGATIFDLPDGRNLPATAFDPMTGATTSIFEYMIGNTDWSEVAAHNVEILDRGGEAMTVPYDFDFSGLVNAPYAIPDPDFGLRSVRERYYRGLCWNDFATAQALRSFRDAADRIVGLFDEFGMLDDATRDWSVAYLRDFFDDIETDERAQRRFLRDCRPTSD